MDITTCAFRGALFPINRLGKSTTLFTLKLQRLAYGSHDSSSSIIFSVTTMTTPSSSVRPPSPNVSHLSPDEQRPPSPGLASVIEAKRRSPPPGDSPGVTVQTTPHEHLLSVSLPGYAPEMVTISARKDDTLAVVADQWQAENDCAYALSSSPHIP